MIKTLELLLTPPTEERHIRHVHNNELIILDKEPYTGEMPMVTSLVPPEELKDFPDIPPPCANTYVLNIQKIHVAKDKLELYSNYTNMRSQFALRRWFNLFNAESEYKQKVQKKLLPIGGAMILETSDQQIVMEERGKVEMPGRYNPAPAGGCETRDWRVMPELFRSIQGEAWEETGMLPGKDYGEIQIIGLVRDFTEAYNPTFTYHTKTNLPFDQIRDLADSIAPEAGEHQRLFAIPTHRTKLLDFCSEQEERIIGNGLGNLLLFGYSAYGKKWLAEAREELGRKCWEISVYRENFP